MIQISIRDVALLLVPLLEITGTLDQSADALFVALLSCDDSDVCNSSE